MDWKRVRDPHRTPTLTYSDADGCGGVFVYGWSNDRTEALAVRANKDRLQLSTTPRTFDIASHGADLEVVAHVFAQPMRSLPFCTDMSGRETQEAWKAIAGVVTIELSPPGVRARAPFLYRATIRIAGAEFVNTSGVRIRLMQPITVTAIVGSGPG